MFHAVKEISMSFGTARCAECKEPETFYYMVRTRKLGYYKLVCWKCCAKSGGVNLNGEPLSFDAKSLAEPGETK